MTYFLIGSNHELADSEFSGKVAFSNEKMQHLHKQLLDLGLVDAAIIISTCNRSEVLVFKRDVSDQQAWSREITNLVLNNHQLTQDDLSHFYLKLGFEACYHLLKVACGLDSLVLGESQITSQIKNAMLFTEKFYEDYGVPIASEFYRLIDETFTCAKEVRTKTELGRYSVSIAYMACKIARELLTDFSNQQILLVGASQTNLLLARHLVTNHVTNFAVVNRSRANGQKFIDELGIGKVYSLDELPELLKQSTLIFSSTSANDYIITKEMLEESQATNHHRNVILFDLAIPNDIDPAARTIAGVNLYNRDDLQTLVNQNKEKRVNAIQDSLPILNKYIHRLKEQNRILQGNNIIIEYRDAIHQQRQRLVEEALQSLHKGTPAETVIENLAWSLTNKILHTPTLMLSSMIKNGQRCELKNIHEVIDRKEREKFQEIVEDTLEKDIFKNSCCRGDNQICCKEENQTDDLGFNEPRIFASYHGEIKDLSSDIKGCPFHNPQLAQNINLDSSSASSSSSSNTLSSSSGSSSNSSSELSTVNSDSPTNNVLTQKHIKDLKGVFVLFEYEQNTLIELVSTIEPEHQINKTQIFAQDGSSASELTRVDPTIISTATRTASLNSDSADSQLRETSISNSSAPNHNLTSSSLTNCPFHQQQHSDGNESPNKSTASIPSPTKTTSGTKKAEITNNGAEIGFVRFK